MLYARIALAVLYSPILLVLLVGLFYVSVARWIFSGKWYDPLEQLMH